MNVNKKRVFLLCEVPEPKKMPQQCVLCHAMCDQLSQKLVVGFGGGNVAWWTLTCADAYHR